MHYKIGGKGTIYILHVQIFLFFGKSVAQKPRNIAYFIVKFFVFSFFAFGYQHTAISFQYSVTKETTRNSAGRLCISSHGGRKGRLLVFLLNFLSVDIELLTTADDVNNTILNQLDSGLLGLYRIESSRIFLAELSRNSYCCTRHDE